MCTSSDYTATTLEIILQVCPQGRDGVYPLSRLFSCSGEAWARCVNPTQRLAELPLRELPLHPKSNQQLFSSQALLPVTRSEKVAKRRYAVGRIASLSEALIPTSLMQVRSWWLKKPLSTHSPLPGVSSAPAQPSCQCPSSQSQDSFRNRVGTVNVRTFQTKPVPLLGQLMGCLTLCCAEEDKNISCGSAEALHATHRIMMVRQSKRGWGGLAPSRHKGPVKTRHGDMPLCPPSPARGKSSTFLQGWSRGAAVLHQP